MASNTPAVESVRRLLRVTYGIVPIVAGLDKFLNVLTDWPQYISPGIAALLPLSPADFMKAVGIIEIAAGLIVLSKFAELGAYVVSAWLTVIAVSLIVSGRYLDVAVRDVVMALGAYTLAVLTRATEDSVIRSEAVDEQISAA